VTAKPNFKALWGMMVGLADELEDSRLRAVLMNHEDHREKICRRLGVVSAGDVDRIRRQRQRRRKTK
jgi:hypothetical protein